MHRRTLFATPPVLSALGSEEAGNTLVETAIITPVFLLLIFGFINFSMVIFGMGNANFASRAALRYASMHSSSSYKATTHQDLINIINPYILGFPANTYTVSTQYYGGNVPGGGVDVTVSITYQLSVMGYSYSGITYTSTGESVIFE